MISACHNYLFPSLPSSNPSKPNPSFHPLAAEWAGFVFRLLIEQTFFQSTAIPRELLVHLANTLIHELIPKKKESIDVAQEICILWKVLWGTPLSDEEKRYQTASKSIDPASEFVKGISLALIGGPICNSLSSALKQRLWGHIPPLAAYSGAIVLGPIAISSLVDKVLQTCTLSEEQAAAIKPWLNMVGRLALGFVPKVHADSSGVHYQYPSLEGYSQTFQNGTLDTPEGPFDAIYEFKLKSIDNLSEEQISIQVMDETGQIDPVLFKTIQGPLGHRIQVESPNSKLQEHWSSYFQEFSPSCSSSLAVGALGSLALQNPFPAAMGAVSCLPMLATAHPSAKKTGKISAREILSKLEKKLNDGETSVRIETVRSLAKIASSLKKGSFSSIFILNIALKALLDPDPSVREEGIYLFEKLAVLYEDSELMTAVVKSLEQAMADPSLQVQIAWVNALGNIAPFAKKSITDIIYQLKIARTLKDPRIRQSAILSFGKVAPYAKEFIPQIVVKQISSFRMDPEPDVRIATAFVCGEIAPYADADSVDWLVSALMLLLIDKDQKVRLEAAKVFGKAIAYASENSISNVIIWIDPLFSDDYLRVHIPIVNMIESLAAHTSEIHLNAVFVVLISNLQNVDPNTRALAAEALGKAARFATKNQLPPIISSLKTHLNDESPSVAESAAKALAEIAEKEEL